MKNEYTRRKNWVTIFLKTRDKTSPRVIIDAEDLEKAFAFSRWRVLKGRDKDYVVTNAWTRMGRIDTKIILLHRLVMGVEAGDRGIEVGFKDGNTYDCRKANLFKGRHIDLMQNHHRKEAHIGRSGTVNVMDNGASWTASKRIYGKYHHFGCHATKDEADRAVREGTLNVLKEIAEKGLKTKLQK